MGLIPWARPAWLQDAAGDVLPDEQYLQFTGTAVTSLTDDPDNKRTIVELDAGSGGGGLPSNYLGAVFSNFSPCPEHGAFRDDLDGYQWQTGAAQGFVAWPQGESAVPRDGQCVMTLVGDCTPGNLTIPFTNPPSDAPGICFGVMGPIFDYDPVFQLFASIYALDGSGDFLEVAASFHGGDSPQFFTSLEAGATEGSSFGIDDTTTYITVDDFKLVAVTAQIVFIGED